MIADQVDVHQANQSANLTDFSIEHILHRAGNRLGNRERVEKFEWLQCSRYCPPRVPRLPKKDPQKRQLGRHPRIPFTSHQLSVLEQKFKETPYLSSEEVIQMSRKLNLADIRVKIWFQNRRARERREKSAEVVVKKEEVSNRLSPGIDEVKLEVPSPPLCRSDFVHLDCSGVSSRYFLDGFVMPGCFTRNKDVNS